MFTTRPEIRGTFGVVASTHWLASAAAMGILERGGNAFDAAVTAGFVLQVVEPHLNGPLGDLPILLHSAKTGRTEVICGQGPSPAAASIPRFRELGLDLIPGTGLLAACVPGAFDAWMLMLRDHGTMRPADVLEAAIGYAENGYPVVPQIVNTIDAVRDFFEAEWPSSAAIYLKNGAPPKAGALFRNPALAATYRRVLAEAESAGGDREAQIEAARNAWYRGFVAEAVDRFCRTQDVMDVSGRRHRGLLTGQDMAGWQATVESPATLSYFGFTVAKCGPWSQGPTVLQTLALLKGFDLQSMDPLGAAFVHTVVECKKLAFADREAWYGDPAFVGVPLSALLSDDYNEARRKLIGLEASLELRPGSPEGRAPRLTSIEAGEGSLPGISAAASTAGEPTVRNTGEAPVSPRGRVAGDTCHVDVVDRHGNMVAATPSGGWLQSSPAIPELGFCLGTRAQMFWLEEGLPNSLEPGKRPRTTLSPSMVLKDGKPYLAFGTPGGDQQDQWQIIMFLRHAHHGMNLQQAIDAPSWHSEHFPSSFWPRQAKPGVLVMESRFPAETIAELNSRGHKVTVGGDWSEGRLSACAREETPDGVILKAGANPRGMQGYAIGR